MSKHLTVIGCAVLATCTLLFLGLWLTKPQHIDRTITKTITVPAQFKYIVGETVYVNDTNLIDSNFDWTKGTVVGINNSGSAITYVVDDTYNVAPYSPNDIAQEQSNDK